MVRRPSGAEPLQRRFFYVVTDIGPVLSFELGQLTAKKNNHVVFQDKQVLLLSIEEIFFLLPLLKLLTLLLRFC